MPNDPDYIEAQRIVRAIQDEYVKWLHIFDQWEPGCGEVAARAFEAGWHAGTIWHLDHPD